MIRSIQSTARVGRSALAFSASVALVLLCSGCGSLNSSSGKAGGSGNGLNGDAPGVNLGDGSGNAGLISTPLPIVPVLRPGEMSPGAVASGDTRPGNPLQLGEGAQLAAGRTFDPVYFDFDSAQILPAASGKLHEYAQWLRDNPRVLLMLAGHCDAHGSAEYNYNLGMSRSLAVQDFLAGEGVDAKRAFPISYGSDRPAAPGDTAADDALNRRVELLAFVLPEGAAPLTPVKVAPGNAPSTPQPITPPKPAEMPKEFK